MKNKYWNEPDMGLWERLYLFEVARGLIITGSVFFENMWKWFTFRKGALTAYYPEEVRSDYSPNNRGRHVLTQRKNGEVQCVSCHMCATACPCYCIEIQSAANHEDPGHPKAPERFEIDYSRCVFCGFCVEACPEDAIRMVKEVPDFPGFDRHAMWATMDLLKGWRPTADPAKVYPEPPRPAPVEEPVGEPLREVQPWAA
ncbi:MAG TPA: 4Fe-4S binding protein [Geomonas sp.]|nr:4Fe-4S binding protein [Geomonas sp.]